MFTGIVEATGKVVSFEEKKAAWLLKLVRSTVLDFEQRGKNYYLRVAVPAEFSKYVVYKGSIAIDGISLTIAEAHADSLAVWLIPHTLEVTNLADCKAGKFVNLEFDILAKYVEKIAAGSRENSPYQPQA